MAKQSLPTQGEGIRLEYTHKNVGAIPFNLPSGGMVRGANSPTHRFVFVATQSDADHLVATGRFVLAPETTEESEPTEIAKTLADAANASTTTVDELASGVALSEQPTEKPEPKTPTQNRRSGQSANLKSEE